ncbi:tetratricopeptide repeat protein [Paragemmobacter straminiformis]|uniref:protein O-GlcNAc transferase n=1 Tax=Paragemmobacter straminiformis TaxID=2045119 RepID=A0A842I8W8_9RHOB|nr:tetratricopeptide repeat protein [Gemmobacter straminiformis]MBC2835807.1 tetratricopeptide repeat protein [Gemmobacter straminiformis]
MSQPRLTPAEHALSEAEAAMRRRDAAGAVAAYERAVAAGAPARLTAQGHALALSELGRQDDAVAAFRAWFAKNPKDAGVANVMGVLLKRAGRLAKAAEVLEAARKLRGTDAGIWQNLGNVYEGLGAHERAAECYRGALRLTPKSAELWRLHGRQLSLMGQDEAAVESQRKAVALSPGHTGNATTLAQMLLVAGKRDEAAELVARMSAADPENRTFWVLDARVARARGDIARATAMLHRVLDADPGHLAANLQLANLLGDGDRKGANEALERAAAAHPDSFEALERLAESLSRSRYGSETAHLERAYDIAKQIVDRFPARRAEAARTLRTVFMRVMDEEGMAATGPLSKLLAPWQASGMHSYVHYELGQVETLDDRLQLVDWHREWGRRASAKLAAVTPVGQPALATGRKLRIGFMSSDLRHHPVTYFALPLLEGYDRDKVEVFCYSFYEREADKVQDLLARNVTGFRHWPKRPDDQVAEGIAADGLDILFELGGSTAMNKLTVMARRPARLGASWLGYPHSAGLEQIDLILTDPYIRPEDPRLLIERAFEMPESWVTLSRMFGAHEIAEGTPEARNGYLSFGTANNPYKYTPACIDAWAAVLRAVPGSRFLFLRPEAASESFIANSRAAFARRDVDPDRLRFVGVRGDHMRHYNEIDVALDSLPHVGGTTTCESLWMGVPTVSLRGPGFPERLSHSNLNNAGLGDLSVATVADYVAKAAELAADPARRRALRHGLRAQIAANPLGQPERFTRHFYELAAKVAAE